jgi:hypothetical protein
MGQGKHHSVVGSELIDSINGSVLYTFVRFALNPGLIETFPRLSREAAVWQLYSFRKLSFRYVTRTGTSTVGSVILSPCYNPAEQPPADEKEASNTEGAVEDVSWAKELRCTLKKSNMFPLGNRKQIRYFNVPGDVNIYDAGVMYVCCVGQPDGSEIGKLWVDYEVDFYIPQSIPITPVFRELTKILIPPIADMTKLAWTPIPLTTLVPFANSNPLGFSTPTASAWRGPLGAYMLSVSLSTNAVVGNTGEVKYRLRKNGNSTVGPEIVSHNVHMSCITLLNAHIVTSTTDNYSIEYYYTVTGGASAIPLLDAQIHLLNV